MRELNAPMTRVPWRSNVKDEHIKLEKTNATKLNESGVHG